MRHRRLCRRSRVDNGRNYKIVQLYRRADPRLSSILTVPPTHCDFLSSQPMNVDGLPWTTSTEFGVDSSSCISIRARTDTWSAPSKTALPMGVSSLSSDARCELLYPVTLLFYFTDAVVSVRVDSQTDIQTDKITDETDCSTHVDHGHRLRWQ